MTIEELQERFNELRRKKWRTVSGHVNAEFIGFIFGSAYPFFIQLETGEVHTVDLNLFFYTDLSRPYLEEVSPYADWPIDARAYFWDGGLPAHKYKGHFAGLNDTGKPMMFAHGMTSFTKMGGTITFTYAELAEN